MEEIPSRQKSFSKLNNTAKMNLHPNINLF